MDIHTLVLFRGCTHHYRRSVKVVLLSSSDSLMTLGDWCHISLPRRVDSSRVNVVPTSLRQHIRTEKILIIGQAININGGIVYD